MSAAPWRVNDGNWNNPRFTRDGFRFPFFDRGDGVSFEYYCTEVWDKNASTPRRSVMDATKTRFGTAYLVERGDLEDNGDGSFSNDLTYASIPETRFEPATIGYTQQWWRATRGDAEDHGYLYPVNFEIAELTLPLTANVKYEYFKDTKPDTLIKSRLVMIFEFLNSISGAGAPALSGEIIAEDSQVRLYKGRIYERATPYINVVSATPLA